jgi:C4-dicarboxylate transporter, DctM subunit
VVGVVGAMLFASMTGSMNATVFLESLKGAMKTSAMIMLIVMGAGYFSVAIGFLGITRELTAFVADLGLSPYMLIIILTLMYLVLGCLLDGFSMIVMTTPIFLPLVTFVGFDPIWFGIYLILMIELAQITPPVGFNLFVISGLTNEDILTIAWAALPFFILLCLATAIVTVFPNFVLYLPNLM